MTIESTSSVGMWGPLQMLGVEWTVGTHVQPPVVEDERRIFGRRSPHQIIDERSAFCLWQQEKMLAQNDIFEKRSIGFGIRHRGWGLIEPGGDIGETGILQAVGGGDIVRELPRSVPALEIACQLG